MRKQTGKKPMYMEFKDTNSQYFVNLCQNITPGT